MSQAKVTPNTENTTHYSDLYNARLFLEINNGKVIWCRDYGGWFIYNGQYWQRDNNDTIKGFAIKTYEELVKRLEGEKGRAKGHVIRSASNGSLNAMVECTKSFMAHDSSIFDINPLIINCDNYTLDLKTGSVYNHKADDFLTKKANVTYKLGALCPLWDNFLNQIFLGDKETIDFMQRVTGYAMTGLTIEQCMFILFGHGRNGKSKFIEAIVNILGDYGMNCPTSTFMVKTGNQIPNDVARLKGARLVTAIESNKNISIDESLIKQVTGGDRITARFLNKEYFDFLPTFKIFLATNHKPRIRGIDTGIWRRIQMVPFEFNISQEDEDRDLGNKLAQEASGIFNWMIEGYNKWSKEGLNTPEKIRVATQVYREEEDDIGQFIKEECILEKGALVTTHEFRDRFVEFVGYQKGNRSIAEYMTKAGFNIPGDNRQMCDGKRQRCFVGLRWISELDKHQGKDVLWDKD